MMRHASERARDLAARRRIDHAGWWAEVHGALVEHGAVAAAAQALGIGRRTLFDWIEADNTLVKGVTLRKVGRPRRIRT